jgi:sugar phosphate isomerase/epimerase
MKLGVDSYSFHRFFGETTKWETPSQQQWSLEDFLSFLEEESIDLASLQTAYLQPIEQTGVIIDHWLKVEGRDAVFTWGHPNGFDGGRKPEALDDALDFLRLAHSLGISQMRIVCGNHFNFSTDPAERFELLRPLIGELLSEAMRFGILVSIENHADFPVRSLMEFIDGFDCHNLGLCLDLGNALRVGDDPLLLIDDLNLDRIFMIQVKDVLRVEGHADPTGWWPTVHYGDGDVDLRACVRRLTARGYDYPIVIELSNLLPGLTETEVAKQAIAFLRERMHRV